MVLQQLPSTQEPLAHSEAVVHASPLLPSSVKTRPEPVNVLSPFMPMSARLPSPLMLAEKPKTSLGSGVPDATRPGASVHVVPTREKTLARPAAAAPNTVASGAPITERVPLLLIAAEVPKWLKGEDAAGTSVASSVHALAVRRNAKAAPASEGLR